MAIKHKEFLIQGVQFHPESIMTEDGKKILGNFIRQVKKNDFRIYFKIRTKN